MVDYHEITNQTAVPGQIPITQRPISHPPRLSGDIYSFRSNEDESKKDISPDEKVDQVLMIILPSMLAVIALIVIGRSFFKYLKAKSKSNEEAPPVEKSSNKKVPSRPSKNP